MIVKHDPGLAASPGVRYRLIVEGKSIPSLFLWRHTGAALSGYLGWATGAVLLQNGVHV
jgi:hypothetical protein